MSLSPYLGVKQVRGAPLNMNEFLLFHSPSKTMIASDGFYGGYVPEETPSWFCRVWFKLMKQGSFRKMSLPVYR